MKYLLLIAFFISCREPADPVFLTDSEMKTLNKVSEPLGITVFGGYDYKGKRIIKYHERNGLVHVVDEKEFFRTLVDVFGIKHDSMILNPKDPVLLAEFHVRIEPYGNWGGYSLFILPMTIG